MRTITPLLIILLYCSTAPLLSQRVELEIREVATGFDTPWEIIWGPDNHLWLTERAGQVFRVDPESGERSLVLTVRAFDHQESGLYGLAFHPDFSDSSHVFLTYSYQDRQPEEWYYRRIVERYTYDAVRDTLVDPYVLIDSIPSSYFHNGGRLLMLADGTLMMTYGDQAVTAGSAQDHGELRGKMLRMTRWGLPPEDNPFPDYEYPLSLIYSTGHRNPQGLVESPSGRIFASEHGPSHSDEINLMMSGRNYGWPFAIGYCDNHPNENEKVLCEDSNYVEATWSFYDGWDMTVAPAGLDFYNGPFEPWRGSLLLAALKNGLMQIKLDSMESSVVEINRYLAEAYDHRRYGRIRDLALSPDGRIFVGTSNRDGRAPHGFPVEGDDRILELTPRTATTRFLNAQAIGNLRACAGGTLDVELEQGGPFEPENRFILQMSDASGAFGQATSILDTFETMPGRYLGSVPVPVGIAAGTGYRIRMVSTHPADTTDASIEVVEILEAPEVPTILREGDVLSVSDSAAAYQWFDGDMNAIDGESGRDFHPTEEGFYTVRVTNGDGCYRLSAPFEYRTTGVKWEQRFRMLDLSRVETE